MNPMVLQHHIPLGVTGELLELVAALLQTGPIHLVMIPEDQLPTKVLVKG